MFVTNWISTTKIQKISEITNFFRHYFLSRTEVSYTTLIFLYFTLKSIKRPVFALFFHFWAVFGLFIRYFLPDRHKNRQNKMFCLFSCVAL